MTKRDLFITALQQAGRRITEQRRIICDYLAETTSHPTPYQVYAEISHHHPEISRATVYNTLNALQQLGAIVEIGFGAGHTHYETDTTPHVNLICLRCHAITDYVGSLPLDDVQSAVTGADGFQPVAMRIDLFGFCAGCRARKQAEIRAQWFKQQQTHTQERVA
jgi:Fur family peroxide stress response transcriptional regulator